MTARTTFGKKGVGDDGGASAAQSRRAAFLATERTRGDRAAETEVFPAPTRADIARVQAAPEAESPLAWRHPVGPRSLKLTYALWLVLGIAGAHRFYLGRTYSGAVQAALCVGCFAATWMQYYQAFAGLGLCWIWMFVDGLKLKQMHAEATAQAETFA
jgi:TM2 domain-containing membrane protein YozV